MKLFNVLLPTAILFISAAVPVSDTYILSKGYEVTINGTSNLHSWNEKVEAVSGNGAITPNSDGSFNIEAIQLKMEVRSIKSDNGIMNNKTYKALKADADPEITLALSSPVQSIKENRTESSIAAKCNLTIAGVTKPVVIQVKVSMPQKGTMGFEGAQTIKMSDYGVNPPTALFGALKTGDDITISFKTSFAKPIN